MDRILYKEADGDITCRSRDFDKVFPTLYAYEETGMTPEEIEGLKNSYQQLQEINDRTYRSNMAMGKELEQAKKDLSFYKHAQEAWKEGRMVILDAPMVPVMEDIDSLSSDVFCPRCKENLSGAFGDEERILLQCPKCGQYIDGKKSMSPAEAEAWLEEE